MEKIAGLASTTLTDREILLLTYQQLQNVAEEFRLYKISNDLLLHDLKSRMLRMEQQMSTDDAIKKESSERLKKQVTVTGVVITVLNFIISFGLKFVANN